jgi:hypothetical protein
MQKKKIMKTKIIKLSVTVILLCLCMTSCKKKVDEDYRPEFVGEWFCPNNNYGSGTEDMLYYMTVDNNSNAVYDEYHVTNGNNSKYSGKARANNHHFKVGRFISFKIEEYPHKIDTATSTIMVPVPVTTFGSGNIKKANWKMTLGSTLFFSGKGTYYKADY